LLYTSHGLRRRANGQSGFASCPRGGPASPGVDQSAPRCRPGRTNQLRGGSARALRRLSFTQRKIKHLGSTPVGNPTKARSTQLANKTDHLRDQGGKERKFYPTGHPLGPGGSWFGLGVVWGVQLGHWAAGFGGRWALFVFNQQNPLPIATVDPRPSQVVRSAPLGVPCSELQQHNAPRPGLHIPLRLCFCALPGFHPGATAGGEVGAPKGRSGGPRPPRAVVPPRLCSGPPGFCSGPPGCVLVMGWYKYSPVTPLSGAACAPAPLGILSVACCCVSTPASRPARVWGVRAQCAVRSAQCAAPAPQQPPEHRAPALCTLASGLWAR
jgi:hypothetical protein